MYMGAAQALVCIMLGLAQNNYPILSPLHTHHSFYILASYPNLCARQPNSKFCEHYTAQ